MSIPFNKPAFTGKELLYIKDAVDQGMLCGDGAYTKKVFPVDAGTLSYKTHPAYHVLYSRVGNGGISLRSEARG